MLDEGAVPTRGKSFPTRAPGKCSLSELARLLLAPRPNRIFPVIKPATKVPCGSLLGFEKPIPSPTRSTPPTTALSLSTRGNLGCTPVSTTATITPDPVSSCVCRSRTLSPRLLSRYAASGTGEKFVISDADRVLAVGRPDLPCLKTFAAGAGMLRSFTTLPGPVSARSVPIALLGTSAATASTYWYCCLTLPPSAWMSETTFV